MCVYVRVCICVCVLQFKDIGIMDRQGLTLQLDTGKRTTGHWKDIKAAWRSASRIPQEGFHKNVDCWGFRDTRQPCSVLVPTKGIAEQASVQEETTSSPPSSPCGSVRSDDISS